ncbi:unnamed protein product, partial [marine sediment metagenome]
MSNGAKEEATKPDLNLPPRGQGKFLKGFHYSRKTEFTSEGTKERNKINPPWKNREAIEKARLTKQGKHYSPKTEFAKGYVPKNAIKKGERRGKQTEFKKGQPPANATEKGRHLSPQTEFKKGHVPWNKGWKNCWSKEMLRRILTRREPNKEESYLINSFNDLNYFLFGWYLWGGNWLNLSGGSI